LTATSQQPAATPPARSSDGPVTVEYVASALGAPLQGYAVGGARSDFGNSDFPTGPLSNSGVLGQVAQYRLNVGNVADPLALYFVSGGSNDVLDAIGVLDLSDAVVLADFVGTLVGNLDYAIQQLYDIGAKNFLLPLLPDLGLTPEAAGMGIAADLSALSVFINSALADSYQLLFSDKADANVLIFDSYAAQNLIISSPVDHGLSNGSESCIDQLGAPSCSSFFFWDSLHPTSAASHLLAADILADLGVPEPGTLVLAGGALLLMLRRRRA
jgi:phospholipase/lecithinase/hemolysin